MQIEKSDLEQIINLVVQNTIKVLEDKNLLKPQTANEKTAYQKTEQLLYNYRGFCRIIQESQQEIEDLRKYGVPGTCGGIKEYTNKGGMPQGLVLDEERVEAAVMQVERSVAEVVRAVALIDKCLKSLERDPYYAVIKLRYFDGRTQEDIAIDFKCDQTTISRNRARLVKELSLKIFPNEYIAEMMS